MAIESTAEKLIRLQKTLENARADKIRIDERLQGIKITIKKEFKVDSLVAAKEELANLEQQEQSLIEKRDSGIRDLEQEYEW